MPTFRFTAIVLCALAIAACQPGETLRSRLKPVIGQPVSAGPADAALCSGDPALSRQMIDAINAARTGQGKTLLGVDEKLTQIARSHACDIAATDMATVAGSNGSNIVDRARAVDYPTCGVAQLIAVGGTPQGVMGRWMISAPHRVELLEQATDDIGVGLTRGADGRLWWSVVLGDNCG